MMMDKIPEISKLLLLLSTTLANLCSTLANLWPLPLSTLVVLDNDAFPEVSLVVMGSLP